MVAVLATQPKKKDHLHCENGCRGRCWSWSNEYHNVHMFYIYSLVLLGLLNSAEENCNYARTNDDVLWDLFVLSKTWNWGGHHVDKMWLTLLPFSGLHLHPPLQSRPPHGSSDLGPCRNKEREGDYKQCFGDINVSNHCWCQCQTFPLTLHELSLKYRKNSNKKTENIHKRAQRRLVFVRNPNSCMSEKLADVQRFQKGKRV